MTIFYIKMKIRAGGGCFRAGGGALGQQGAPPCYSSLWEIQHVTILTSLCNKQVLTVLFIELELKAGQASV